MNDRMQTIADLSFNPSSDFELFALESAIDEAMAEYEATCEAYGRSYNETSMESFAFDIGMEGEDCECDYDEDEADEAIEASLREVGHSIMEWWRAIKSKFIMFCRKVSSTVTNAVRKVQATWATRNLNANDNITISAETSEKIRIAKYAANAVKQLKAPLASMLDQYIKAAVRGADMSSDAAARKSFGKTSVFADGRIEKPEELKAAGVKGVGKTMTIKGSELRTLAKDLSNAIKDSQDVTTLIDRKLNDGMRNDGFRGRYVSAVRSMVGEVMQAMTGYIRAGFTACMEVAKQATKKKDEDSRRPKKAPKQNDLDLS